MTVVSIMDSRKVREWQMKWLTYIWNGCCEDIKCPNNINYGLKPESKLRIKLPSEDWKTI